MRRLILLTLACSSAILGGCSGDPLVGDFDVTLSGGYLLVRTDVDDVEVVHAKETSHHKGVPAKVIEIAWNGDFILAKQQELKDRRDFPRDKLPVPVPEKFWYWIVDVHRGDSLWSDG